MKILPIVAFAFLLSIGGNAFACGCIRPSAEQFAFIKGYTLTKVKISEVSFSERIINFFKEDSDVKSIRISVLEDIVGNYPYDNIEVDTRSGIGSCGLGKKANYAKELYIASDPMPNRENKKLHLNICTTTTSEFAEKVKQLAKSPPSYLKSVDISKWNLIEKNDSFSLYADKSSLRKDQYGSYIWTLQNNHKSETKSQKINLHIDCKEKMYTIDSEHNFSDFDAKGDVLSTGVYGARDIYSWEKLTPSYSKILKIAC
jgi:hypothetical protein